MANYKWLVRGPGIGPYELKSPGPASIQEWLEAMDEALNYTSAGQASGAPAFDHGRMLFERIALAVQRELNHESERAHSNLKAATDALKIATWGLAAVTIVLGIVEAIALLSH